MPEPSAASSMPGQGSFAPGPLAEEAMVSIFLRGQRLARLMCTPRELDELALGFLYSRGLIRDRSELSELSVCPDRGSVSIDVIGELRDDRGPERFVSSACGDGMPEGLPKEGLPRVRERLEGLPGLDTLGKAMRSMFAASLLHAKTGGVHCAALLYEAGDLIVREDVGRHNAVDKVLGRAFFDGRSGEGWALLSSGRIAFDMVYKAAMADIALVASRSIPTSAAYELALEAGITLVGRALSPRPLIYAAQGRSLGNAAGQA